MKLKHFIITRFNYTEDYEHLEQRIELFRRYTMPSIYAQTCQKFEWLIIGQPDFEIPGARCFFEGCPKPLPKTITAKYMEYIESVSQDADLVLTTRLDNDDMLMPRYVQDVQMAAVYKPPLHLFETRGYRYNLRNKRFYRDKLHHKELTSPFLTLTCSPKKLVTVYCGCHSTMWKKFNLTILPRRRWVQLIHTTNWLLAKPSNTVIDNKGIRTRIDPFVKSLAEREIVEYTK